MRLFVFAIGMQKKKFTKILRRELDINNILFYPVLFFMTLVSLNKIITLCIATSLKSV